MSTLFSIIVPIYNVAQFLPQCIGSILGQTYTNFELILVDDGSTDTSGKICDEYASKDKRIIVIHKPNGGLVSARQAGTQIAKGEYIVPVDGDDWVSAYLLQILHQAIQQTQADVVCYHLIRTAGTGFLPTIGQSAPLQTYFQEEISKRILPNLIRGEKGKYFAPNQAGKAFLRTLYTPYQLMADVNVTIGEDAMVTYPIIRQASKLVQLPQVLYYYRMNPNSMSRVRIKGFSWDNIALIYRILDKQVKSFPTKQEQLFRNGCHFLFNAATSWLQTDRPYREVKKEILYQLNQPLYRQCVEQAHFTWSKDWVAQFTLKHRWILVIKLYAFLANHLRRI